MTAAPWHARTSDESLRELGSSRSGLSAQEAAERLARVGPNRLPRPTPVSALTILLDQLKSVVVLLLVAAAAVSLALGDRAETLAIGAVLAINTLIGFATEWRARRAMDALLQFDVSRAVVTRDGHLHTVDAATLVPGDLVRLDAGQRVPADVRLVDATDLRTDEAALTGESLPVSKRGDRDLPADTPLAERSTMAYKGTTVSGGTALAVVTATGPATELGRIGALVGGIEEKRTPLERRLDALGRRLVWLALGVAALVAALGAVQGAPLALVIEMGIALAVAAVPEALPAVATIALAVGLRRMARRQALVRRLPAVEALGSTTVVCTDKTRTLTSGRMSVVRLYTAGTSHTVDRQSQFEGEVSVTAALEVGALASQPQPDAEDGQPGGADPVDLALLSAASAAGIERDAVEARSPRLGLIPFSSSRKFMAAFHEVDGVPTAFVKGAPDRILEMCGRVIADGGEVRELDDRGREALTAVNHAMAGDGLRVLALASGRAPGTQPDDLRDLTFVALVGLADPPAEGVKEAIAALRAAGLRTIMLTGDQRSTAGAIGRQLDLLADDATIVEGRELDAMAPGELAARLPGIAGFSRITPEHKLRLVEALQASGEIVAMLGDGVNDAPALRRADVGVAMGGRGTDAAKEAAAIVLRDDRFPTIVAAVEEGRVIFDNIRKFVFYLFSCNVAEVLVLLFAALLGLPLPLLPLQILWLNMVTDTFPALALALEPGDPDVMVRPPRDPHEALLSRQFLGSVLFYGALITAVTLAAFVLTLDGPVDRARTVAFMTLAFAQLLHLGNARSDDAVVQPHRVISNPYALGAVALSLVLQLVAARNETLSALLGVVPLAAADWWLIAGLSVVPAIVGQGLRLAHPSRRPR